MVAANEGLRSREATTQDGAAMNAQGREDFVLTLRSEANT